MEKLSEYIAFDLEFNTVAEISHIIQVSAVKFRDGVEVDNFDTYVYTDVPLQSFINGLTGITSEKIAKAPNALKSDLPLLAENNLDLIELYKVDLYDEAYERRSSDLNGIANLKLTSVADFLGISGHGHNSMEDARMTALVYEKFMEFDENKSYLIQQEEEHGDNPFAALGDFFD